VRLATAVLVGAISSTACQPDQASSVRQQSINVAVDIKGNITLNGERVTEEELKTHFENGTASLLVEKDIDGQVFVTVNGKKMTEEEFFSSRRGAQRQ
jgi:biopolymer transport protein ExbD